jgi:hypothetical protein
VPNISVVLNQNEARAKSNLKFFDESQIRSRSTQFKAGSLENVDQFLKKN